MDGRDRQRGTRGRLPALIEKPKEGAKGRALLVCDRVDKFGRRITFRERAKQSKPYLAIFENAFADGGTNSDS